MLLSLQYSGAKPVKGVLAGFWTPSLTAVDPTIPYLPLEDAAGGVEEFLVGSGTLVISTTGVIAPNTDLIGSGTLVISTTGAIVPNTALVGSGSLALASIAELLATLLLEGSSALVIGTIGVIVPDASLVGSGQLILATTGVISPNTNVIGSGVLVLSTNGVINPEAGLVGSGTLVLATTVVISPEAPLVGSSLFVLVTTSAITTQQFIISGVTKDSTGTAKASATVYLFKMQAGNPSFIEKVVSDGSGNYSFVVEFGATYWIADYKSGSPDVAGVTLQTLTGV